MLGEHTIRLPVSLLVSVQLLLPPLGVCLGTGGVVGARVPEAAVDVNGHPGGAEDDVGARAETGDGSTVDAEAETAAVELRADRQLRSGVAAPEPRHLGALRGGRWNGSRGDGPAH